MEKRPDIYFTKRLSVSFEFQECYECGEYFELEGHRYDRKNLCEECGRSEAARENRDGGDWLDYVADMRRGE